MNHSSGRLTCPVVRGGAARAVRAGRGNVGRNFRVWWRAEAPEGNGGEFGPAPDGGWPQHGSTSYTTKRRRPTYPCGANGLAARSPASLARARQAARNSAQWIDDVNWSRRADRNARCVFFSARRNRRTSPCTVGVDLPVLDHVERGVLVDFGTRTIGPRRAHRRLRFSDRTGRLPRRGRGVCVAAPALNPMPIGRAIVLANRQTVNGQTVPNRHGSANCCCMRSRRPS